MDMNKKLNIILIIVIFGLLIALFFLFSSSNEGFLGQSGGNNVTSNQTDSDQDKEEIITTIEFSKVSDYNIFFNINNYINNFYSLLTNDDYDKILYLLNEKYIASNNINASNVSSILNSKYTEVTYVSRQMYEKSTANFSYYFVKGDVQNYDNISQMLTEEENIYFLIVVDSKNKTYSIMPLVIGGSFQSFAQEYNILSTPKISKNDYNLFKTQKYTDELISIYYVSYYKNLLYLNSEKAYNMLDTTLKAAYGEYQYFVEDLPNIYQSISTNIFSYSIKNVSGQTKISVNMSNGQKIEFTENEIMNFIVNFERN